MFILSALQRQNKYVFAYFFTFECEVCLPLAVRFDFRATLSVCGTALMPPLGIRLHQTQTINPVMQTKQMIRTKVMAMTIFSVSCSFLALARICAWHLESQAIVTLGCQERLWDTERRPKDREKQRRLLSRRAAHFASLHSSIPKKGQLKL